MSLRKVIKTRSSFPTDEAVSKLCSGLLDVIEE
jgi:hypothetical protein